MNQPTSNVETMFYHWRERARIAEAEVDRYREALQLTDEQKDLLAKVAKLRNPDCWDVDWNSLCIVLCSDGSGEFQAKATNPVVAEGIVAAVRFAAEALAVGGDPE